AQTIETKRDDAALRPDDSLADHADGHEHVRAVCGFREDAARAGSERLERPFIVIRRGEEDDGRTTVALKRGAHLDRRVQRAIHAAVDEKNIRSVARRDDVEGTLLPDDPFDTFGKEAIVAQY